MPYDSFIKKFRRISVNSFAVDDEDKYQKNSYPCLRILILLMIDL